MTAPSVVIFDLGKVLLDFEYATAAQRIAARSNMAAEEIRKLIDHTPLLFRFESGRMTAGQFFSEVRAATGFGGTLAEFGEAFADIFIPIKPIIQLQAHLRRKGVPTYVLSNTNELSIGHIRRRFPFFANFDGYVFSYEHGAMKPEEKIYEVSERLTGRRGTEILFLDDRAENLAPAARRGWQILLHEAPEKTQVAFKNLGLL